MVVQVCRADRQPAVIDDADLRVHVERTSRRTAARGDRGREEAPAAAVRLREDPELSTRHVRAVVRFRGQHYDYAKAVARRVAQLSGEDPDELGGPQELALEV